MNRIAQIAALSFSFVAAASALAAGADGAIDATANVMISSTQPFASGDVHTGRLDFNEPEYRLVIAPTGMKSRADVLAELNSARDAGQLAISGGDPSYDAPVLKQPQVTTRLVASNHR